MRCCRVRMPPRLRRTIPARPTAARPAAARLPVHPGPVEARKAGFPQACIGGFVSNRVEGGWSQTRQRCTAASE